MNKKYQSGLLCAGLLIQSATHAAPLEIDDPGNQQNIEGETILVPVSATDNDGGQISYSAGGLPAGLSINSSTGEITGTIAYTAATGSSYVSELVATSAPSGAQTESETSKITIHWNVTNTMDPKADVVYLRQVGQCDVIDNCETDFADLMSWVWSTRNPTSLDPLVIDIGPGEFYRSAVDWMCDGSSVGGDRGYVTFQGAGRLETHLKTLTPFAQGVVSFNNCTKIMFKDLTLDGDYAGNPAYAVVYWDGGGESVWENIDIINGNKGWYENCAPGTAYGLHYWFGSRISAYGTDFYGAYFSSCSENWFYNGEITAVARKVGQSQGATSAVKMVSGSVMQIFGSAIRAIVDATQTNDIARSSSGNHSGMGAMVAQGPGSVVHMHGGIVTAKSNSAADISLFGVKSVSLGTIHVIDTAFNVQASGAGIADRIMAGGPENIFSPFLWPPSSEPPAILSLTGADTFVETDCSSSGCLTQGNESHMMIYNQNCSGDPWFDTQTGECRSGGAP